MRFSHKVNLFKNHKGKIETECRIPTMTNKNFDKKRKSKQNSGGTVFRCCLPCRGGSAAPATSPPNSPIPSPDEFNDVMSESKENIVSSPVEIDAIATTPISDQLDTSSPEDIAVSIAASSATTITPTQPPTRICQQQTSPLPHIEEEEENEQNHFQISSSNKNNIEQQARVTFDKNTTEEYSSSPSPRNKHKNRLQIKNWNRTPVAIVASSETLGSSGSVTASASTGCGSGSLTNNSNNINTSVVSSVPPTSGLLLPKMQAEQGSIGDLQKYHSRYLKNRRHTLANVR